MENWLDMYGEGSLIKRADGSYSRRGLWDNIRANRGSGRKPTAEMLRQERKIRSHADGSIVEGNNPLDDPKNKPTIYRTTNRSYYDPVGNTIYYNINDDPNSPDNILKHEGYHWAQNMFGDFQIPELYEGPLRKPQTPINENNPLISDYYNRPVLESNTALDNMVKRDSNYIPDNVLTNASPSMQFVPQDILYNGITTTRNGQKIFIPGADDLKYSIPGTVEGDAQMYQKYAPFNPNPIMGRYGFKDIRRKDGGWIDAYDDGSWVTDSSLPTPTSPSFYDAGADRTLTNYQMGTDKARMYADGGPTGGGGVNPIYVTDPNDPRLKAYNDSLNLYTLNNNLKNSIISSGKFYPVPVISPPALVKKSEKYKITNPNNPIEYKQVTPDFGYNKISNKGLPDITIIKNKNIQPIRAETFTRKESKYKNEAEYEKAAKTIKDFSEKPGQASWIGYDILQYKKPVQPVNLKKYWTEKDVYSEYWKKFKEKYPDAIGIDPDHVDKDNNHLPVYDNKLPPAPPININPIISENAYDGLDLLPKEETEVVQNDPIFMEGYDDIPPVTLPSIRMELNPKFDNRKKDSVVDTLGNPRYKYWYNDGKEERVIGESEYNKLKLQGYAQGGPVMYNAGSTVFTKQNSALWVNGGKEIGTQDKRYPSRNTGSLDPDHYTIGDNTPLLKSLHAFDPSAGTHDYNQDVQPYHTMRLNAPDTTMMARHGSFVGKHVNSPRVYGSPVNPSGMFQGPTSQRGGMMFANGGWIDKYDNGSTVGNNNEYEQAKARYIKASSKGIMGQNEVQQLVKQYPQLANDNSVAVAKVFLPKPSVSLEQKINKKLNNPMGRAAIKAEEVAGIGDDPIDNYRHPLAGMYTAQGISNLFPKWLRYTGIPQTAGFFGSTVLGIGHELQDNAITQPDRYPQDYTLWDAAREGGEDAFNNMIGAAVGITPFASNKQKENFLFNLSQKNYLPDGYGKGNMYFKKDGGWIHKYANAGPVVDGNNPSGMSEGPTMQRGITFGNGGWINKYEDAGIVTDCPEGSIKDALGNCIPVTGMALAAANLRQAFLNSQQQAANTQAQTQNNLQTSMRGYTTAPASTTAVNNNAKTNADFQAKQFEQDKKDIEQYGSVERGRAIRASQPAAESVIYQKEEDKHYNPEQEEYRDDTTLAPEGSTRATFQNALNYVNNAFDVIKPISGPGAKFAFDLFAGAPAQSAINISNTIMGDRPIRGDKDVVNFGWDVANVAPFIGATARGTRRLINAFDDVGKMAFGFSPKMGIVPKSFIPEGKPSFQSEIDWGKWNSEIPDNKTLMQEYNAIEESSKANGTWMKNPDGSPFQGTPEQFVQQNSENFKKAYPEGFNIVHRGGDNVSMDNLGHPIVFTADKVTGQHYSGGLPFSGVTASPQSQQKYGRAVFDLYYPKSNNNIIINNQGRSWREIPRKYFGDNPPLRDLHNPNGDFTSTDNIARWMVSNDKNSVRLNNIFDSYDADFVDIINHKPGNYLKSAVGNNGMFDMTNPNIYKGLVPAGIFGGIGLYGSQGMQQQRDGGWIDKYDGGSTVGEDPKRVIPSFSEDMMDINYQDAKNNSIYNKPFNARYKTPDYSQELIYRTLPGVSIKRSKATGEQWGYSTADYEKRLAELEEDPSKWNIKDWTTYGIKEGDSTLEGIYDPLNWPAFLEAGIAAAPSVLSTLELPAVVNGTTIPWLTGNNLLAAGMASNIPGNIQRGEYVDAALNAMPFWFNPQTIRTGANLFNGVKNFDNTVTAGKNLINQTGEFLTTQTPLKNTYKIFPEGTFTGYSKLRNPNSSYRVAGFDAAADLENTGVVRSNPTVVPSNFSEGIMGTRTTGFPSFQKGYADLSYLPDEGGVVFQTDLPTFKRGEVNPVTGNTIKGRHYAHRVIDPNTGAVVTEIPATDVKVFESTPHWFKGFKETTPSRIRTVSKVGTDKFFDAMGIKYNPGSVDYTNALTNKNPSKDAVYSTIKDNAEYIKSDLYKSRRMAATGETSAQVDKATDQYLREFENGVINLSFKKPATIKPGFNTAGEYSSNAFMSSKFPFIRRGSNITLYPQAVADTDNLLGSFEHELGHAFSPVQKRFFGYGSDKGFTKFPALQLRHHKSPGLTKDEAYDIRTYFNTPHEQGVRGYKLNRDIRKSLGLTFENTPVLGKRHLQTWFDNPTNQSKLYIGPLSDVGDLFKEAKAYQMQQFGDNYSRPMFRLNIQDWLNKTHEDGGYVQNNNSNAWLEQYN